MADTGPAPVTSARPPARPQRIVQQAATEPAPEPEPEEAPSVDELLAEVQDDAPSEQPRASQPQGQQFPTGAPLTSAERGVLQSAIQRNWNIGNLQGYPADVDLRITVGFRLSQNGQVEGEVRLLSPRNPDGFQSRAFETARRAIMIASRSGGIQMPAEKYGRWRDVEVTFDPRRNQVGY